jgi:hypothetical protein
MHSWESWVLFSMGTGQKNARASTDCHTQIGQYCTQKKILHILVLTYIYIYMYVCVFVFEHCVDRHMGYGCTLTIILGWCVAL